MAALPETTPDVVVAMPEAGAQSPWRLALRRFFRNKLAWAALVVLVVVAASAILAPWIAPDDYAQLNLAMVDHGPTAGHWLGFDDVGRDELSRLLWGGRVSLAVSVAAVAISIIIGIVVGALAGFFGGIIDNVLMRIVDVILSIPILALLIVVAAILGPSLYHTIVVIGIVSWTGTARILRGELLSVRTRDFVEAARASGAGNFRLIARHLVPNALAPVIVTATIGVAQTVLLEAALSFLGLGVQQPIPSWGNMLNEADNWRTLALYWWEWVPPGVAILLATMSVYVMGDALRDALDPRQN